MKKKIFVFLNDRYNFLENYLKTNLPDKYYLNKISKIINNSIFLKEYKLSNSFKKDIKKYWNKYDENIYFEWHKAYVATNSIEDIRYIPENIFYRKIDPALNKIEFRDTYGDKNIYDKIFPDVLKPKTIIRNMNGKFYDAEYKLLSFEKAIGMALRYIKDNMVIIKPTLDTGAGKNISVINLMNKDKKSIYDYLLNEIKKYDKDFIIQEYIKQHEVLNKIHKNSLNTLRIITLRLNNNIYFLSGIVRMGNNGSVVDNASVGGLTCGFNSSGELNSFATNHNQFKKFTKHPYSNFVFKNSELPNIKEAIEVAKISHEKLAYFDIASWDIAINESSEPVLIEVNLKSQDINFHQRNNGALFGEYTTEVLNRTYNI